MRGEPLVTTARKIGLKSVRLVNLRVRDLVSTKILPYGCNRISAFFE